MPTPRFNSLFAICAFALLGVPAAAQTTWNPADKGSLVVLSSDKRDVSGQSATFHMVRATVPRSSGKHCFETEWLAASATSSVVIGIAKQDASLTSFPGGASTSAGVQWINGGNNQPFVAGVAKENAFAPSPASVASDVITVCVDFFTGSAWWARNGNWYGGDPATGSAPHVTGISGAWFPAVGVYNDANKVRLRSLAPELEYRPAGFQAWADTPLAWGKQSDPVYFRRSSGHLIEPIDVRSHMRVYDGVSAASVRQEIVDFVWPSGRPSISFSVAGDPLSVTGASSAEKWSLTMANDIVSHIFFLEASAQGNCLFIWHAGHEHHLITGDAAVLALAAAMLAKGCDVLLISMSLHGVNDQPEANVHNDLHAFDGPGFTSMLYFLEPVVKAIDDAILRRSYDKIGMAGLSGGGWTTAVAGAIDTRITHLYPVAGSMPFELDMDPQLVGGLNISSKRGDYEQSLPAFYAIASYFDLYVMGAQDRRAMHFYLTADNCCFPAWAANAFSDRLSALQPEIGGKLIFREDTTATSHQLTPWATKVIVEDFARH